MNFEIYNPTSQTTNHRMVLIALFCFAIFALAPNMAHAASQSIPWETATEKFACSLTGSWIKWAAVIAIALAGVMFGLGELSGPFQKTMQIAGGFSVAVGAAAVAGWLMGITGSVPMNCT